MSEQTQVLTLGNLTVRLLVVHTDARAPRAREVRNKGNAEFHQQRMRPETIQISYKVAIYVHRGGGERKGGRENVQKETQIRQTQFSLYFASHGPMLQCP